MQTRHQNQEEAFRKTLKNSFQKRYKYRQGNSLPQVKEKQEKSGKQTLDVIGHSQVDKKMRRNDQILEKGHHHQDALDITLHHLNFNHHSQDSCVCSHCSCGRHLCKLDVIKPDLKKASVYQHLFNSKKPQQIVIVKAQETSPLKGNHLDLNSIYLKDFKKKVMDKLERPKPQDELKFEGPAPTLTTYGTLYPGHKGENQYIKPTNKHAIGEFPLLAKTVYSTEFVPRKSPKSDSAKLHDSLKTGTSWFGASTYNNTFRVPNPEHYLPKERKIIQKHQISPDYPHQFETNYKNEYIEKPSAVCPSKIHLELSSSSQHSKHLFRQNSDYRSMSPQFKAIATSKHFYI